MFRGRVRRNKRGGNTNVGNGELTVSRVHSRDPPRPEYYYVLSVRSAELQVRPRNVCLYTRPRGFPAEVSGYGRHFAAAARSTGPLLFDAPGRPLCVYSCCSCYCLHECRAADNASREQTSADACEDNVTATEALECAMLLSRYRQS